MTLLHTAEVAIAKKETERLASVAGQAQASAIEDKRIVSQVEATLRTTEAAKRVAELQVQEAQAMTALVQQELLTRRGEVQALQDEKQKILQHAQAHLIEKGVQWQVERTQTGLEVQTMQDKLTMAAELENKLRQAGQHRQPTQRTQTSGAKKRYLVLLPSLLTGRKKHRTCSIKRAADPGFSEAQCPLKGISLMASCTMPPHCHVMTWVNGEALCLSGAVHCSPCLPIRLWEVFQFQAAAAARAASAVISKSRPTPALFINIRYLLEYCFF